MQKIIRNRHFFYITYNIIYKSIWLHLLYCLSISLSLFRCVCMYVCCMCLTWLRLRLLLFYFNLVVASWLGLYLITQSFFISNLRHLFLFSMYNRLVIRGWYVRMYVCLCVCVWFQKNILFHLIFFLFSFHWIENCRDCNDWKTHTQNYLMQVNATYTYIGE